MSFISKKKYFDFGSFTPINKRAAREMKKIIEKQSKGILGNPVSSHSIGVSANKYLEEGKKILSDIYNIKKNNVLFTSGATEANHIAMRTAVLSAKKRGIEFSKMHIVLGGEEHSSIYRSATFFESFGVEFSIIKSGEKKYSPDEVVKYIKENTILLSLCYVSSLNGLIQPIHKIAKVCKEKNNSLLIHTDAAQATAYMNCSPVSLGVDFSTIDSAKCFGPQGAGALLFMSPEKFEGLQGEHTLWDKRPGTPSIILLYGFAIALQETYASRKDSLEKMKKTREYLIEKLKTMRKDIYVNGVEKDLLSIRNSDLENISPHILNISFSNVSHSYLSTLLDVEGILVSTGNACTGPTEKMMRISLTKETTKKYIDKLISCIEKKLPLAKNSK